MILSDLLILDTETTGLPKGREISAPDYPRLKQVGLIQFDHTGRIYGQQSHLVRVDMPTSRGAERVHGISDIEAGRRGITELLTLMLIYEALNIAQAVIGWGVEFDLDVIRATALRLNRNPDLVIRPGVRVIDLKQIMTPILNKQDEDGKQVWPSLSEGYQHLFQEDLTGAHDAHQDAMAVYRIFQNLWDDGLIADLEERRVA